MRIIKFRAWYDNGKGMVYFDDFPTDNLYAYLMQLTGLKDKNGKEIYEGDIFVSPSGRVWLVKHGEWKYWDKSGLTPMFGIYTSSIHDGTEAQLPLRPDALETIEVIGNIYENPELLTPPSHAK